MAIARNVLRPQSRFLTLTWREGRNVVSPVVTFDAWDPRQRCGRNRYCHTLNN